MGWPKTVRKEDLEVSYYRGSGPGGQNKNKRDTACRIKHIPTGIMVTCEDQRTQGQNRKIAFRNLANKLVPIMKKALQPKQHEVSNKRIRTYHEIRDQVIDHRTKKSASYREVMNGNLEKLWNE